MAGDSIVDRYGERSFVTKMGITLAYLMAAEGF